MAAPTGSFHFPLSARKYYFVFVLLFLLLEAALIGGESVWRRLRLDVTVVHQGHAILLAATFLSFYFFTRSLNEKTPFALVKYVYLGLLVKLMICAAAAMVYILSLRRLVNISALATCGGLYLVYTGLEVYFILQLNRIPPHAQAGSPS